MRILALLTPAAGKNPADFDPLVVAEDKAAWAAYRAGTIRELYFQPEPLTVSMVFEAESHAEVERALAAFPMVEAGLLNMSLVTQGPWVTLETLFDKAHLA